MVKLSEKEAAELFKESPTGQTQYTEEAHPTRQDWENFKNSDKKEQTIKATAATETTKNPPTRTEKNELPMAGIGRAVVQGQKVLRSIPIPSWINTGTSGKSPINTAQKPPAMQDRSNAPAWIQSGVPSSSHAPPWLHGGMPQMGFPEHLSTAPSKKYSKKQKSPKKPSWIQY